MSLRDRSDCTAIWIRGWAAHDRAHVTVELVSPGPSVLQLHEVEEVEGTCAVEDLLELIA